MTKRCMVKPGFRVPLQAGELVVVVVRGRNRLLPERIIGVGRDRPAPCGEKHAPRAQMVGEIVGGRCLRNFGIRRRIGDIHRRLGLEMLEENVMQCVCLESWKRWRLDGMLDRLLLSPLKQKTLEWATCRHRIAERRDSSKNVKPY